MDARTFSETATARYAGPEMTLNRNLRSALLRMGHLTVIDADLERARTLDDWIADWERRGLLRS